MEFWLFLAVVYIVFLLLKQSKRKKELLAIQAQVMLGRDELSDRNSKIDELNLQLVNMSEQLKRLERFSQVADASEEAKRLLQEANETCDRMKEQIQKDCDELIAQGQAERDEVQRQVRDRRARIEQLIKDSNEQAAQIIAAAKDSAERIGGDAYRALKEADSLQATATAMSNIIRGYGDKYLKPTFGLLDELAELYSFDDAGKQLKLARERTLMLTEDLKAASCDYVEAHRRSTAIHFVVDAFNGKVDSILTRAKQDNYGILEQQIKDAFAVVNHHGSAFRNARITDEYLNSRMQELRWAVAVHAVREREREEQREIRERIREEERARREIDKALKDAAKEEESIEKAMAKMRQQIDKAGAEQKAKYEAQLAELQARLAEAEAKSQRALSMAQQTRAGHVYIISNEGSFGENVFKVGMTRRLEPSDRVRELSDASVPFPFDIHAMIWSEDAPALERELHTEFVKAQVNKVNPRKEFFRVGIKNLREAIETRGIETSWTMRAVAAEFRESLAIEERMKSSPLLEDDWVRQQAKYEIQKETELVED
ncbi:DUF4041 domain-containing protein [Paenalcaligenes sp. Me52]|uniref:DUF4041 domain-containing protein n=1 Tax=Paenalcaligenes sp. Me52 TaxID=3392038 RepID=UPI003D273CD4